MIRQASHTFANPLVHFIVLSLLLDILVQDILAGVAHDVTLSINYEYLRF